MPHASTAHKMRANTSSAGSHEKVTIQSSKLPETTQSNVQGQSAVEEKSFNTDQVSTSTNSGSQTLQEDEEETPIIVPSIMSVLLSILGIVYKVKSRGRKHVINKVCYTIIFIKKIKAPIGDENQANNPDVVHIFFHLLRK